MALKEIINEEFQYLFDLLPSTYEPHGFMHELNGPNESLIEDLSEDVGEGPNLNPSDWVDFVREMILIFQMCLHHKMYLERNTMH